MHTSRNPIRSVARVAGVGMVEALVALTVLSVGLLGTATLFVTTLQAKSTALSRMQAINLASDIADRIRANRSAGNIYILLEATTYSSAPSPNCATASCTPAQMAATDKYLWSTLVDQALVGRSAKRSISFTAATATAPNTYTIEIKWIDPSTGSSLELSHSTRVQI